MDKIKILIADDHPMVVEGIVASLKAQPEFDIVATTNSLKEIEKLVESFSPHILLMDYHFVNEEQTGIDVCRSVTVNYPCTKVIVISSFSDVALIKEFVAAGASGYLLKTASRQEYIDAIQNVFAGGESFGKDVRELLIKERLQESNHHPVKFTKTEKDILKLIIQGHSTQDIAKKLFREKSTIDSHRKSILSKFHIIDKGNTKPSKNIMYYVNKFNVQGQNDYL